MSNPGFIKTIILLFSIFSIIMNKSISDNENIVFEFPNDINYDEYKDICKETIFYDHNTCFSISKKYEEKITNILLLSNLTSINEINKEKVSYIYYNLGNIYYHGHISKEPDLDKGLAYFIISSYFGSPQSKYKLSIILSKIESIKDIITIKFF